MSPQLLFEGRQKNTEDDLMSSHLSVELQLSSAGSVGIDGEISGFVDDAAQRLQTWTVTFHLRRKSDRSTR